MRIICIWYRQASLAGQPGNDFLVPQGVASRLTIQYFWWRAYDFPFSSECGQLWIAQVHSFDWTSGCYVQMGDWATLLVPSYVPVRSVCLSSCLGQRGGWVALVAPGHVPSESGHGREALGRRGGGKRLAYSPHVPTESCGAKTAGSKSWRFFQPPQGMLPMMARVEDSHTHGNRRCCAALCLNNGCAPSGQRGGEAFSSGLLPHVPSESVDNGRQHVKKGSAVSNSTCLCTERFSDYTMPGRCFSEDGLFCLHDVAGVFQAAFPQDQSHGLYLDWCGLFFIRIRGLQIGVGLYVPAFGANFVDVSCARWQTLFDFRLCESQPFQLTGSCIFLHRQNVLSVGYAFTGRHLRMTLLLCGNLFSVGFPTLGFAMCVDDAPYHMVAGEAVGKALCDLITDAWSTSWAGGVDFGLGVDGKICWMLNGIQYCLDFLLQWFPHWIWMGLLHLGQWWQQAFAFLVATVGLHLCQLLLYAMRLKGGKCNADNILRCSRRVCSGCPLSMAIGLEKFSPRLSRSRRPRRLGYSRDLWLLLLLLCALCPGVNAGAGTQYNVDSTGFRAERRSRKLSSAVYN